MASWARHLTSLATALVLSGSPAVLSACMALCLQAVPMSALAHEHGAPAAPVSTATVMHDHSHHHASTTPVAADAGQPAPGLSTARLGSTCHDCCPDGVALVAGPGVERTDAHALAAAQTAVPVPPFLLTTAVFGAAPHGPPPTPSTAPLVLRV